MCTYQFVSLAVILYVLFIKEIILATCATYALADIARDLNDVWDLIASVTVGDQLQAKSWENWTELCSDTQRDPYLQDILTIIQQHLLFHFAARNRRGYYIQGRQVVSQTPETTLRHMAQTNILEGYSHPRQS